MTADVEIPHTVEATEADSWSDEVDVVLATDRDTAQLLSPLSHEWADSAPGGVSPAAGN